MLSKYLCQPLYLEAHYAWRFRYLKVEARVPYAIRYHRPFINYELFPSSCVTGAPARSSFAADIAFIVDSSSSLSPFQYTRAKRFVRILSDYLNVVPGRSRGALVTFGESPVVVFTFDSYKSVSEYRSQVAEAHYLGGVSSISSTLSAAATLFPDARGSYPWIAILVTPWRPDNIGDSRSLEILARPLLNRGVWLYVLSIGEDPYVGWLRPMLVETRDAFSVVSFRDLPGNIGPIASYITNDNCKYNIGSPLFASYQVMP